MARRRYLSTRVSIDSKVNKLAVEHGDFAALLYTWMIPHAGDDGCLEGTSEEILGMVAPLRRDKSEEDVSLALASMQALGLIEWDGIERVSFPPETFYKYQTYIRGDRRGNDNTRPPNPAEPCESPPKPAEPRESPPNSAKRRETPRKAVSFNHSFNPSLELKSNHSISSDVQQSSITDARAREPTTNADQPFEINGHDPVVLAVMQSFSLRLTEPGYRSMMSTLKSHQSLSKQWVAEAIACYGDYARRGEHINNAAALFDRWLTNVEIGRSPPTATRDSLEADKWARNAQDPVVIRHQQANEERKRKREEEKRATTERSGSGTEGEAGRGAPQNPRAP